MAKIMKLTSFFAILAAVVCTGIYIYIGSGLCFSLAITFGTTAYHFLMRLIVGHLFDGILHNTVDYRRKWFRQSRFENMLYSKLKVKRWKTRMPTYAPQNFDSRVHSWDEIVGAMCQAELVHEVIIVLSFLPIVVSVYFGAFWVFLVTSLLAACYDGLFVIMQRYNRPRVIKLINRSGDTILSEDN
jgi:hypothetical protein